MSDLPQLLRYHVVSLHAFSSVLLLRVCPVQVLRGCTLLLLLLHTLLQDKHCAAPGAQ